MILFFFPKKKNLLLLTVSVTSDINHQGTCAVCPLPSLVLSAQLDEFLQQSRVSSLTVRDFNAVRWFTFQMKTKQV